MAEGTRSQEFNRKLEDTIRTLFQEHRDSLEKEIDTLRSLVLEVHDRRTPSPTENVPGPQGCGGYSASTRLSRLDFPKFNGDDFRGWLYRCEQFYEIDGTPPDMKVKIAAMHLEGKALQWHQVFMKARYTRDLPSWEESIKNLAARFGDSFYDDPMGDLMTLKQRGTVDLYQTQFEDLLNRVDLPESYTVSCFLSGLKDEIQIAVKMFMPKTLSHAMCLAKMEEKKLAASQKPLKFTTGKFSQSTGSRSDGNSFHTPKMGPLLSTPHRSPEVHVRRPLKTLTSAEMDEKRKKGLCFWCDEKYDLGHVCQRKQLYKVEVWSDERDDENRDEEGEIEIEEEVVEEAHLSIHAMSGITIPNFHTMKVHGRVGNKEFSILMDGGSSHNFIHPNMITKFGIRTQQLGKIAVTLASGGRMMSSTYCKEFKWAMHGHEFVADAIVLPIKDYDMVLGVQWLSILGDILWNFNTLKMEFIHNNQRVVLLPLTI